MSNYTTFKFISQIQTIFSCILNLLTSKEKLKSDTNQRKLLKLQKTSKQTVIEYFSHQFQVAQKSELKHRNHVSQNNDECDVSIPFITNSILLQDNKSNGNDEC